jgi:hypothetical protein
MSPLTRSQNWPVPSWQCFLPGSRVRFLLPNTNTPWQKSEELGWKDKIALKVDSRSPYQFAPNGLTVLKVGKPMASYKAFLLSLMRNHKFFRKNIIQILVVKCSTRYTGIKSFT